MNLAFKDAELAAASSKSFLGGLFSRGIEWKTGGRFSHVEMWLTGPKEDAECFSSREPKGTGYQKIDLTQKVNGKDLWTCVEIPLTPEQMIAVRFFTEGTGYRRYGWWDIVMFLIPKLRYRDRASVICSGWNCLVLQRCLGLFQTVEPWTVSPSALYELVTGGRAT